MKLSCLPVSLYEGIFSGERSVLDWVRLGGDLGLDGIDVSVKFFPSREKLEHRHKHLSKDPCPSDSIVPLQRPL